MHKYKKEKNNKHEMSSLSPSVQSPAHQQKLVWAELSNSALHYSTGDSKLQQISSQNTVSLSYLSNNHILKKARLKSPASEEQVSMGSGNSELRHHTVQLYFLDWQCVITAHDKSNWSKWKFHLELSRALLLTIQKKNAGMNRNNLLGIYFSWN